MHQIISESEYMSNFSDYILQAAKAIEYLHQQHIIYRDLKSENVLVWEMPPPFHDEADDNVHIKLADYGKAYFLICEKQSVLI